MNRRRFLKRSAAAAAVVSTVPLLGGNAWASGGWQLVAIVLDPDDALCKQAPARWAVEQLRDTLNARDVSTRIFDAIEQVPAGLDCIVVAGRDSRLARQVLESARTPVPDVPESLAVVRGRIGRRPVLLACGADARGLVYALLEVADVAGLAPRPTTALQDINGRMERPANRIRSVARLFVNDVEDKGWFNDRAFWREYLTMLATQRFNRFSLTLGIGYDFTTDVRDCYFHFAYPFLVSVPGYDVKAVPLPDSERDSNLAMLKFISDETARRGLHFQLGIWTHAYRWTRSPRANFTIQGLTDETQGPYSRDALRTVLEACPSINGVTIRIHGESGVPEGSYDFWKTVFDGMAKCGRPVELDMHAKGMNQKTVDVATATGLPVVISPKYWAEHMGLPYMQAAIRPTEMPPPNARDQGFFALSSGSRSFLRYGYGDLLVEGRKFGVLHRIWPGTQRMLLWGDPAMAAGYGRVSSFCGSDGLELFEPLSFKGRKGSGLPGGREGYADESLKSDGGGWKKYLYSYRLWGRLTYNPDAEPETWRRLLRSQFGREAAAVEPALANASRILPVITTAHCPSAANNTYWPEMYLNMPIVDATKPHPYGDSPSPKRFGTVSPLDPEIFSTVEEFADELLKGAGSLKYSPAEVAQWLETFAANSERHMKQVKIVSGRNVEFRRLVADIAIQNGTGRFFAWKFRAAVLYALFAKCGHRPALEKAIEAYRRARAIWAEFSERAKDIYARDITYGFVREVRGHWLDRLPAMDDDIADMVRKLEPGAQRGVGPATNVDPRVVARAVAAVLLPQPRPTTAVEDDSPGSFRRGQPVTIEAKGPGRANVMRLHYRHVNQAERWRTAEMERRAGKWTATIPAAYTDSVFHLQYYLEMRDRSGAAWMHPGLGAGLMSQPYVVLKQA